MATLASVAELLESISADDEIVVRRDPKGKGILPPEVRSKTKATNTSIKVKSMQSAIKVACPQLDTKTGKVYKSKTAAGIAVAHEYNLPVNNFVWYSILKLDKGRFVDATALKTKEVI